MSSNYDVQSKQPLMKDGDTKGTKAESYIVATTDRSGHEPITYKKDVEAVEVRPVTDEYIGLTKEELAEYATDPFWRTLRIALFILFWLAWIGMLAAAVLIVIVSPKCPAKHDPAWWQKKVCYEAWTPSLQDSNGDGVGDINGLESRVTDLRRIGAQTIRATPMLQHDGAGYDVTNFKNVQANYGTLEEYKAFVDSAHSSGIYVIMDLPMSVTSTGHPWFVQAKQGADNKMSEHYIWVDAKPADADYWAEENGRFYQVEKETKLPVLNWANSEVVTMMRGVLSFWLDRGVDGFYMPYVEYLGRSSDGATPDYELIAERLSLLRNTSDQHRVDHVDSKTPVLLYASVTGDDADDAAVRLQLVEDGGLNYILNDDLVWKKGDACFAKPAECLFDRIDSKISEHDASDKSHPMWEIGNSYTERIGSRAASEEHASAAAQVWSTMMLMLPGSVNTYYGDEIGMVNAENQDGGVAARSPMQWNGEEANAGFSTADGPLANPVNPDYKEINYQQAYYTSGSGLKVFRRLAKMRDIDAVVLNGATHMHQQDGDVLLIGRYNLLNTTQHGLWPGRVYVTMLNFGAQNRTIDMPSLTKVLPKEAGPAKGSIVTVTSNVFGRGEYFPRSDIDLSGQFTIGPYEAYVVKFKDTRPS